MFSAARLLTFRGARAVKCEPCGKHLIDDLWPEGVCGRLCCIHASFRLRLISRMPSHRLSKAPMEAMHCSCPKVKMANLLSSLWSSVSLSTFGSSCMKSDRLLLMHQMTLLRTSHSGSRQWGHLQWAWWITLACTCTPCWSICSCPDSFRVRLSWLMRSPSSVSWPGCPHTIINRRCMQLTCNCAAERWQINSRILHENGLSSD